MAEFTIRIPDDLDDRVKAAAAASKRSKNGEIEWLIERGLDAEDEIEFRRSEPRETR